MKKIIEQHGISNIKIIKTLTNDITIVQYNGLLGEEDYKENAVFLGSKNIDILINILKDFKNG